MKHFVKITLASLIFSMPISAHTTTHMQSHDDSKATVKIYHFHPIPGKGLMGIQIGGEDSKNSKVIKDVYYIHKGKKVELTDQVKQFVYKNGKEHATGLEVVLDKTNGYRSGGDYIVVSEHIDHYKKDMGLYIKIVTKSFINKGGFVTDWNKRVVDNAPEIIPLVSPTAVYKGDLFRARVVNEKGEPIPFAKIHIEYLNHNVKNDVISTEKRVKDENRIDKLLYTDSNGTFSFIPQYKGTWDITLVDGDSGLKIDGKKLMFNSIITIEVQE